jgi:hypothetical protein
MNDLPAPSGNNPINTNTPINQPGVSTRVNKEIETGRAESPFRPAGQEVEVSPEVVSSGVKVQPTAIPIPSQVSQLGVKPAGQNIPAAAPDVNLPLSDDQIAAGLKQSVWSSWRWLSEWCVRKLKQVHTGLKNIHGKLTRVRQ